MADPFDPRTPVLIGAGQFTNRVDAGDPVLEPVDLMVEAARRAAADTGVADVGAVLAGLDAVRVPMLLSWRYHDPGRLVAERLGATPSLTDLTVMGGNYVQTLVNATAREIVAGTRDLVLLTGGEAWRSRAAARAGEVAWTEQPDDVPEAPVFGEDKELSSPEEVALGLFLPVQIYPLFDVALRAAEGLTVAEHRQRIGALWSRFSAVAAKNPHAWIQREHSPDEITTPAPDNRMISSPYTKLLCSNNNVEQAAALLLCSAERAAALGVPRDRWVFLHAGADAHDEWFLSNRPALHRSEAMRSVGAATLELAGAGVDDLAHVDLYSCFPSAVQVAARELGLGLDRDLTVTGGMSFAGGPWNNYAMHGIAAMAGVLREDAGALGLTTANGGYLTKHAMGLWSTRPPAAGTFRWRDTQDEVDALPGRPLVTDHEGPATIESYTVVFGRDAEPERAIVATLTPDGGRAWAESRDAATLASLLDGEHVGERVHRTAEGTLER